MLYRSQPAAKFSRAERRRLQKLRGSIDRVTRGDLAFFARHPHRKHRIREADCAEIEYAELVGGDISLTPGNQHCRAVRYLTPDVCLSRPLGGPRDIDPESIGEEVAAALFRHCAPDRLRINIQGDITHEDFVAIVEALRGRP